MANVPDRGLNNPFLALRHRNFRLYWLGMCVSLIGTWMQNIAQPWMAYSLTKSPLLLSLVGTLQFLPTLLFSLFAGVIIDRLPKKKILLFTQIASLVITLLLAVLISLGSVRYWHILVAATALGIVNTLDMPARHTFVIELTGKEDLMNAIALNSTVFNIARILGPALAGFIMGVAGVAVCFYINATNFLAVIISLFFIKPLPVPGAPPDKNVWASVMDGLRYIRKNTVLLKTLVSIFIVSVFALNYNVLVPVFAKTVLHQQEEGFGFLMSFVGVGSFFGAMLIATMSKGGPSRFIIRYFPLFTAVSLIVTGCTGSYIVAAAGLAATGFCFVAFSSTANSSLQLTTDDAYRGRVMSVFSLVFLGSVPIGNPFAGTIAEHFGPSAGFIACGAMIILLTCILLLWRGKCRHAAADDPEAGL